MATRMEELNATNSPLLKLPPELRNKIFAYALSNRIVYLYAKNGSYNSSKVPNKFIPANNLQLICRQMRAETRSVEMKINRLKAHGRDFTEMIKWKDERVSKWSGLIFLCGDCTLNDNPDEFILHRVINWAFSNPNAKIYWRVQHLNLDTRRIDMFLKLGLVIEEAIRGKKHLHWSNMTKMIEKWKRREDTKKLNAPNIRFLPRDQVFAEKEFRETLFFSNVRALKHTILPHYDNDSEKLVRMVRGWYTDGI